MSSLATSSIRHPSTTSLFTPFTVGPYTLSHRITLSPMTRYRATPRTHIPLLPLVPEYYTQRGSLPGTLLITEGVIIAPRAGGEASLPGIWSSEQIVAWKQVTDSVHENGSRIFLQLWALGRTADAEGLRSEVGEGKEGDLVSASDLPLEGGVKPRALTTEEIREYVGLYVQAAKNSIEAGFDGVELHGANGYLLDQFTQDISNTRTDEYGGSIENRSRFPLEAAKAVVDAVGAERVGYRISPFSTWQNMGMTDPYPQFHHLIQGLKELKLAYLHVVEFRRFGSVETNGAHESVAPFVNQWLEDSSSAALIAGGFKPDSAKQAVDQAYEGKNVGVVFGKLFTSNPDLAFRIREGLELTPFDRSSFYTPEKVEGYTTWPFSKEFLEYRKDDKRRNAKDEL